jgi:hypothetical protein
MSPSLAAPGILARAMRHPFPMRRVWRRARYGVYAAPVALLLASAMTYQATSGAFSASASTGLNRWEVGTVVLDNSSSGMAVFDAHALTPGDTAAKCVVVSYAGDLAAGVRLSFQATSGALTDQVTLSVDEGYGTHVDCSDFTATAQLAPATVISALAVVHKGFDDGLGSWSPTGAATRTFRFVYALPGSAPNSVQGATGTTTLVWEARSR